MSTPNTRRSPAAGNALKAPAPRALEGYGELSSREREVLHWVAEGLGDAQIGDLLGISARTVGAHISRILEKLDLENRTVAAVRFVEHRFALQAAGAPATPAVRPARRPAP